MLNAQKIINAMFFLKKHVQKRRQQSSIIVKYNNCKIRQIEIIIKAH